MGKSLVFLNKLKITLFLLLAVVFVFFTNNFLHAALPQDLCQYFIEPYILPWGQPSTSYGICSSADLWYGSGGWRYCSPPELSVGNTCIIYNCPSQINAGDQFGDCDFNDLVINFTVDSNDSAQVWFDSFGSDSGAYEGVNIRYPNDGGLCNVFLDNNNGPSQFVGCRFCQPVAETCDADFATECTCGDGKDNDCDGSIDCADTDCFDKKCDDDLPGDCLDIEIHKGETVYGRAWYYTRPTTFKCNADGQCAQTPDSGKQDYCGLDATVYKCDENQNILSSECTATCNPTTGCGTVVSSGNDSGVISGIDPMAISGPGMVSVTVSMQDSGVFSEDLGKDAVISDSINSVVGTISFVGAGYVTLDVNADAYNGTEFSVENIQDGVGTLSITTAGDEFGGAQNPPASNCGPWQLYQDCQATACAGVAKQYGCFTEGGYDPRLPGWKLGLDACHFIYSAEKDCVAGCQVGDIAFSLPGGGPSPVPPSGALTEDFTFPISTEDKPIEVNLSVADSSVFSVGDVVKLFDNSTEEFYIEGSVRGSDGVVILGTNALGASGRHFSAWNQSTQKGGILQKDMVPPDEIPPSSSPETLGFEPQCTRNFYQASRTDCGFDIDGHQFSCSNGVYQVTHYYNGCGADGVRLPQRGWFTLMTPDPSQAKCQPNQPPEAVADPPVNCCDYCDGVGESHQECKDNKCAQVPGAGLNQCHFDGECEYKNPHMECSASNQCVSTPGLGLDKCSGTEDCTKLFHYDCDNTDACVQVSGPGPDSCQNSDECKVNKCNTASEPWGKFCRYTGASLYPSEVWAYKTYCDASCAVESGTDYTCFYMVTPCLQSIEHKREKVEDCPFCCENGECTGSCAPGDKQDCTINGQPGQQTCNSSCGWGVCKSTTTQCTSSRKCEICGGGATCNVASDCDNLTMGCSTDCDGNKVCVPGGANGDCSNDQDCKNKPSCTGLLTCEICGGGAYCDATSECEDLDFGCSTDCDGNKVCAPGGVNGDCSTDEDCEEKPSCTSQRTCEICGGGAYCDVNSDCDNLALGCSTDCDGNKVCVPGGGGPACSADSDCQTTCSALRTCEVCGGGAICGQNSDCSSLAMGCSTDCNGNSVCVPGGTLGSCSTSADCGNKPPTANGLVVDPGIYCAYQISGIPGSGLATFLWNYADVENDAETNYQLQIGVNPAANFDAGIIFDSGILSGTSNRVQVPVLLSGSNPPTCSPDCNFINFGVSYYWRVKVWESTGLDSGWVYYSGTYRYPYTHPSPTVSFAPANSLIAPNQIITFNDNSTCYDSGGNLYPCKDMVLGSCPTAPDYNFDDVNDCYGWWFEDVQKATPDKLTYGTSTHVFGRQAIFQTRLEVCDGLGCCDSYLNVRVGGGGGNNAPQWWEISPY